MGALLTMQPPAGTGPDGLTWVVTFGPLAEADGWDPVVCGPYERRRALALAEAVVAAEPLLAVVEPVLPCPSLDDVRAAIDAARR